ncbi:hypothetical protein D3C85_1114510 [compost metagenome]
MAHFSKRLFIVNFFGTLFYLSCLLQWMWATLPYMPGIVRLAEILQGPKNTPAPIQETTTSGPPSLLLLIIALVATAIVIGLTLYVLIKFPVTVAKSAQKMTQNASARIVPIVTHHAKLPEKKRRRLTARIVVYLKLTICVLPVILCACTYFFETELGYGITMIIAAVLGLGSLLLLSAQLLIARWLKVKSSAIW